jgi:hypothetical protein
MSDVLSNPRKEPDAIRCRLCNAAPQLTHKILKPRTGGTLRMYKCQCGEQMWLDYPA